MIAFDFDLTAGLSRPSVFVHVVPQPAVLFLHALVDPNCELHQLAAISA